MGVVYLIGAGPGDPGLITVRGAELLAAADVVIYDYLANEKLLDYCPRVEKIYVGKKGANHAMPQEQINQLLIEKAQAGKVVARLKGGDPFVFGRGGEEGEALAAAGVPFEVVPGITSAIGGLAYAGIPVTHRDFNSSFTLVTGHEKNENASDLNWGDLAKLPCVAFYMGVGSLRRITEQLIAHGKDPQTPAATVQWASTPRQRTVVATLATIEQKVIDAGISSPAITIIGKVVTLRPELNWFENRPLFGQRIIVTRTRQQASELSSKLTALGAEVIEAPTIEIAEPADWKPVDRALDEAGQYDWIVFTSVNGVLAVKRRLMETNRDVRIFGIAKIAAIGNPTAEAIRRELALGVDLCPKQFIAEALAEEIIRDGQAAGKRVMLLRADIGRQVLVERLVAAGAQVRDVSVYETRRPASLPDGLAERIRAGQIDWITFTSSSTARNFVNLLGNAAELKKAKIASIGPVTTQTLRDLGIPVTAEAARPDIDGLIDAILKITGAHGEPATALPH
jgi:uroporphyrinogen III methyltransferase/synthase